MAHSKPTVPEFEEILQPLAASLAETQSKLLALVDKLAPVQKYDQSADAKQVASEIASYHEQVSRILSGDMNALRNKWNLKQ
jgi:predicted regulator of Ras-like GTPase activity (Roadblock/LC7/MglB family)